MCIHGVHSRIWNDDIQQECHALHIRFLSQYQIRRRIILQAVFKRLRTYSHRTHTAALRTCALSVLVSRNVDEIGLRIHMIKLAGLW